MDLGSKILSDYVVYSKYSQYRADLQRRETWNEICDRVEDFHVNQRPEVKEEIRWAFNKVRQKKVLPSMRSMQFAGKAMEKNQIRGYNCSACNIDHHRAFAEVFYLLLLGCGTGWGIRWANVKDLPNVGFPGPDRKYVIGDSIEGWADAVNALMKAYFYGAPNPRFIDIDIRPKDTPLSSGGKAPGPEPLMKALENVRCILVDNIGSWLRPIDVLDILCHLSDAVLAGGIRRSAAIAIFDADDLDMLNAKTGEWWVDNPQRARSNNSASMIRGSITKEEFHKYWELIQNSGAGEPGIFWTNDSNLLGNPCQEISLNSCQFCNLSSINAANVHSQHALNQRARAAAIIGTVQASYTDFQYLRPEWREVTEREALLGISMTGIAAGKVLGMDLTEAAGVAMETNKTMAAKLGINEAARVTCIKPEGTGTIALGRDEAISSGIHAYHDEAYIRRVRILKNEPVYGYLEKWYPELLEDDVFKPDIQSVLSVPVLPPANSITRSESPIDLLERVKKFNHEWIKPGHRSGVNTHNVSCTVSIKDDEWTMVRDWLWDNQDVYSGISVLPYSNHTYQQAPFESISRDRYKELVKNLKDVDFSALVETTNNVVPESEVACAAGQCELV